MKLLLPLLLAAVTQPGSDPQKLFLAMEERITNATSVEITFEAKMEGKQGNGNSKGTLTFAPKGKARADLDLDLAGMKLKMLMVSDGTQMATSMDGQKAKVDPTPEFLAKALVVMAAKTGIMPGLLFGVSVDGPGGKKKDPFADLRISDFKLGRVEKIGDKDAQMVKYQLTLPNSKEKLDAAVWIDIKTTLPLKRQLVMKMGDDRITLTENYSVFRLNARLDAKVFDLPK